MPAHNHKIDPDERERFAPLQRYKDQQRAIWYLAGAVPILILWVISLV